MEEKKEIEKLNEIWTEEDKTGNGNGKILYKRCPCKFCKETTTYMNVGNSTSTESWICCSCHMKTNFGAEKLIRTKTGWYFEKVVPA